MTRFEVLILRGTDIERTIDVPGARTAFDCATMFQFARHCYCADGYSVEVVEQTDGRTHIITGEVVAAMREVKA